MKKDLAAEVLESRSLDELLRTLLALEASSETDLIDASSLPTFGGETPGCTLGVWSWDADRLLVGDGSWSDAQIISREQSS